MSETETFCTGSPVEYALKGVEELSSEDRRSTKSIDSLISNSYGANISSDCATVIERLYDATDGEELVKAMKIAGLDHVDDYETALSGFDLDEDMPANLGTVMRVLDGKFMSSHAPRSKDVSEISSKQQRETIYLPELVNTVGESGTVYMAKSLNTVAKVRIAWDLHDDNEVIVVDDYEKWEKLLGWEKLKDLPHGKNQIREELGDQLSQEVLDIVAGDETGDTETKSDDDSSSRGRRTRTKPTDEILNLALSSRHKDRKKMQAKDIKEDFEDDGETGSTYTPISMLILFPTTTDLNMSDHYWVAGSMWEDVGKVAIANCNKGTFEYLNDCEEVWHIEDYLAQAEDYEFDTNYDPVTLGTINTNNLVLHVISAEGKSQFAANGVIDSMPDILPEFVDNNIYNPPTLPHSDDMLYALLTPEDVFWLRPELRKMENLSDDDGTIFYATKKPRDVGSCKNLSSDYKLYARARLPEWDFDCTELDTLDGFSYSLSLDDGGFELVETLAKLHDAGMQPFSETPEARWKQ